MEELQIPPKGGWGMYPIALKREFSLNPGQEEYAVLGSHLHRRNSQIKEDLKLTLNGNFPINDNEVEITIGQFGDGAVITFEANARECQPSVEKFRWFIDDKAKWTFDKVTHSNA
jgi:hypothetical protein